MRRTSAKDPWLIEQFFLQKIPSMVKLNLSSSLTAFEALIVNAIQIKTDNHVNLSPCLLKHIELCPLHFDKDCTSSIQHVFSLFFYLLKKSSQRRDSNLEIKKLKCRLRSGPLDRSTSKRSSVCMVGDYRCRTKKSSSGTSIYYLIK